MALAVEVIGGVIVDLLVVDLLSMVLVMGLSSSTVLVPVLVIVILTVSVDIAAGGEVGANGVAAGGRC